MARTFIVVDNPKDWAAFYPSDQVITFKQYLEGNLTSATDSSRIRVINLCGHYKYLSDGYYCSLLAEARNHHVIPSIRVLNDLSKKSLYLADLPELSEKQKAALPADATEAAVQVFFGDANDAAFRELGASLFERFPCPLLEVQFKQGTHWEIAGVKVVPHKVLDDQGETHFAEALDHFSRKVWRQRRSQKPARFDLAILLDNQEALPPSNASAIKKFVSVGRELGIDVELIGRRDYRRLSEFDGLFIRATTNIDHYTYRFARKAAAEGLVVVDDPTSIIRCTNKVYLTDLFATQKVPMPETRLLHRGNRKHVEVLEGELQFPMVLKIPDGAFSRGVVKVKNADELQRELKALFRQSALVLAQKYLYTDFDWRIGIFNRKPIYACRYYMVRGHWQIYRHGAGKTSSGGFDTLPTFEVPKHVMQAALKACDAIGDGLYGVDVKECDGRGYVIEVNDNPNIDAGIEDKYAGKDLYRSVLNEFIRRMEEARR